MTLYMVFYWLLLGSTVGYIADNAGTEFIIAFMENQSNLDEVEVFVTTEEPVTVSVNISTPGYSAAIFNQVTVVKGQEQRIKMEGPLRASGTSRESKAVHVTADNKIVIFGVNKATSSNDVFLGIPVTSLGKEYYAVCYDPASQQTQILIVAVSDSTSVSVSLPSAMNKYINWQSARYYGGNTITESMNRFDTFQVVHNLGDLTGARITADKNIAVFSGNKKTKIGQGSTSDHLAEMWYPVDNWGKMFITIPIPDRTVGDKFRIIASESSTDVQISGGHSTSFSLSSAGDFHEEDIGSTSFCYISSTKPIMVVQFVRTQQGNSDKSDPSMIMIPPINQFSSSYAFSTPRFSETESYTSKLMIAVKDADKSGIYLDDVNTVPNLTPISGTEYSGGYIEVSEGTHTIKHSSRIKFFGVYIYGRADQETYAFPVGTRLTPINKPCTNTVGSMTVGDAIDNDCDGWTDEELCTPSGIDDDSDGSTDEDCVDLDECEPSPCSNTSVCVDGIQTYTCVCNAGYTGSDCSTEINECDSNPCQNSASCTDQVNNYTCQCVTGTTGSNCEIDVDECASTPCQNQGNCTDMINQYTCTCKAGYSGVTCTTDIDECSSNPCQNGAACTDSVNGYTCQCTSGYTGTNCDGDIDECASSPCQNGGTCTDGVDQYTCQCAAGYTGSNCQTGTDVCSSNPCQNGGTCNNQGNSFDCTCDSGFTNTTCDVNIDDCISQPCTNGNICIDGVNSYTCQCASGYTGANCDVDIDECASSPCQNGASCVNGVDQYTCQCVNGYTGGTCDTDIDECTSNPCQNGGNCTDQINQYDCICASGFTNTTCDINIDDCTAHSCNNSAICVDGVNNFTCECQAGYTGATCDIDIDDCSNSSCLNNGTCVDLVNTYSCNCTDEYTGTYCQEYQDPCKNNPCLNNGICVSKNQQYTCICATGFTGDICDSSIIRYGDITPMIAIVAGASALMALAFIAAFLTYYRLSRKKPIKPAKPQLIDVIPPSYKQLADDAIKVCYILKWKHPTQRLATKKKITALKNV